MSEELTTRASGKTVAAVVIAVLAWASAFVVIRDVGHAISPAPMTLLRLAVAGVALTVPVVARHRGAVRLSRKSLLLVVIYAVVWLVAYTIAINAAEQHVDAGTTALLVNIAPLLVAFGAGMFLGEGYPRALIGGGVVALAGVAIISLGGVAHRDWIGVVLSVAAAVLYAGGVLVQKVALRSINEFVAIWLGCLIGTVVLLPWAPQLAGELAAASPGEITGAVYLGLCPTALGFTAWAYALRRMNAGRLTVTTYAIPAVSVLISWLALDEIPTVFGLVGGVICLIGIAISRRTPAAGTRTGRVLFGRRRGRRRETSPQPCTGMAAGGGRRG
ncbi:DMT family transporter [Amycolatopsis taiwanensis]|uniref:DMT family transporter n=1 Tax=Amycolatopsis taiwanensis TaxID=342230 RepID=UPI0004AC9C25|nr:DMT family transporter [Amycolatopsis taiwanensis]